MLWVGRFLKLTITGYLFLLILIIIGHTGISSVNWPFELFLSYIRQVLIVAPLVAFLAWLIWRKSVPVLSVVVIITALPFLATDKFQSPSKEICKARPCLKVVSLNLRKRSDAIEKFAATDAAKSADIIGLYEIPFDYTGSRLRSLFPDYEFVHLMSKSPRDDSYIGSFIAVLSKHPPSSEVYNGVSEKNSHQVSRGFIVFPVKVRDETIHITALHTRLPLSYNSASLRNNFLDQVAQRTESHKNSIYMGDFNLTPWTPQFRKLPGKRAGDPRFISTWDAQRFWTGIPIDHIVVSENIEVVEAGILDPVGSDHFPIMAVVKIGD